MLFKCYLYKTESFGVGFLARFQFKRTLTRVPTRCARFCLPCIRVPVFAFFSCKEPNLRILSIMYYLRDSGRSCRRARRYGTLKRPQLYVDRFIAAVFSDAQISVPAVKYLQAVKKQVNRDPTAARKTTMHGKICSHHGVRSKHLAKKVGFALGE